MKIYNYIFNNGSKQELPKWPQGVGTDFNNIWQRQEFEWVDERLRTQLEDMLRGLDRKMAQEVIGCILYFINWGIRNYLDLWHIDGMLKTAYNKIEHAAAQQGIKLPLFP